jgi:mono/diheme cytochrome c family protein
VKQEEFMNRMLLAAALLVCSQAAVAQTEIKHISAPRTSASSGHEMFMSYCATCHGKDGKGAGPAAGALKAPPADLTILSKNNGGKFPAAHVATVLRDGLESKAHGSQEMPVWGPILRRTSHGQEGELQMRLANLNRYIESLQEK